MPSNRPGVFALCESRTQVDWLVRREALLANTTHLVAATPGAAWALENEGLAFIRLEDFDERKPVADVEALLAGQIEWARWVDAFLQEQIPRFKKLDFRPARSYLINVKNAWDTCIHRASLLHGLGKNALPGEVLFFSNRHPITFDKDMAMRGSVLAESVPAWAAHYGVTQHVLPALNSRDIWEYQYTHIGIGFRHTLSRWRQDALTPYRSFRRLCARPGGALASANRCTGEPTSTLILDRGHDVTEDLAERLRHRKVNVLDFEDLGAELRAGRPTAADTLAALTRVWDLIVREDRFWRPGGWQDWSIQSALTPMLRHFWFTLIPALLRSMTSALEMIDRRHPDAMVFGAVSGPERIGLVMAARSLGVPVVLYLHGGSVGDIEVPTCDVLDRYWARVMLLYGEGQMAYLRQRPHYDDANVTPIPVGSARIDQVRRNRSSQGARIVRARIAGASDLPVVVYVPGVFWSNFYRFESHDFRSLKCFDMRRKIAALFNRHPEVRFVYKSFLSQGHDPTLEMLAVTCPNCVIVGDIPLTELQWAADALIHEIPSSGMVESLITDKPLIACADQEVYRMSPLAKALLRRRLTLAETGTQFVCCVESFLAQGCYAPVSDPDQEYLRAFVTHLNDGSSAERAVDAICRVATGETIRA